MFTNFSHIQLLVSVFSGRSVAKCTYLKFWWPCHMWTRSPLIKFEIIFRNICWRITGRSKIATSVEKIRKIKSVSEVAKWMTNRGKENIKRKIGWRNQTSWSIRVGLMKIRLDHSIRVIFNSTNHLSLSRLDCCFYLRWVKLNRCNFQFRNRTI